MSLTTPYSDSFQVADGVTTKFFFDKKFEPISKNYVKCEVYNADGSVIVPDFEPVLEEGAIKIVALTQPDGTVLNAPREGSIVRIYRDVPETQNTTVSALQASTAKQIVSNFDNIVAMIQELQYSDEHFTVRSTLPQRDLQIDLLRDIDDQKLVYWDNEKRKLVVTNYRQDELLLPADKEDILEQANAYSDEQNALLESRINGKLTAVDAQIDANADAIQKTRDDYIAADSEIHQILNSHAGELTTLRGNQASLGDQVSGIEEKIPGTASATNHLITKQQLLDEEMDIRDDLNEMASELQTQITAQAAEIATKQDKLNAGDNIVISGNTISATGTGGVGFDMQVVDQLPATGKKGVIYLVPKDGAAPDVHDEYVWIDSTQTFELIGNTQVDLTDYVKNTDYATSSKAGIVKPNTSYGLEITATGELRCVAASGSNIASRAPVVRPITPQNFDYAVKVGVTTNTIELSDDEKTAARTWLGAVGTTDYAAANQYGVVKVSGQYGVGHNTSVGLFVPPCTTSQIDNRGVSTSNKPLTLDKLDYAVKTSIATNTIELTDEEKAAAQAWLGVESGGGASLPDQTGNAGKFLMTDGTGVSWGEALVNNNAEYETSLSIGKSAVASSADYNLALGYKAHAGVDGNTKTTYNLAIGALAAAGSYTQASYSATVAIGHKATVRADGAILISAAKVYRFNDTANTFAVANNNGTFTMMSADGTIPADRIGNLDFGTMD